MFRAATALLFATAVSAGVLSTKNIDFAEDTMDISFTVYNNNSCNGTQYDYGFNSCQYLPAFGGSFNVAILPVDECDSETMVAFNVTAHTDTLCTSEGETTTMAANTCLYLAETIAVEFTVDNIPAGQFCEAVNKAANMTTGSLVISTYDEAGCSGTAENTTFFAGVTELTPRDSTCQGCCPIGDGTTMYMYQLSTCIGSHVVVAGAAYSDETCSSIVEGTEVVAVSGVCYETFNSSSSSVIARPSVAVSDAICYFVDLLERSGVALENGPVTPSDMKDILPFSSEVIDGLTSSAASAAASAFVVAFGVVLAML